MKTSELTGAALDWSVAKCAGVPEMDWCTDDVGFESYTPSTDWAQGGPIIEREAIEVCPFDDSGIPGKWGARDVLMGKAKWTYGPTPLIAALRCYVASKLGDEVEIPDSLS